MNDDVEQRLVALETRTSFQERMAEDLSDVVAQQARTIDILTVRVHQLECRLFEIAERLERSPQDDKPPPHY